MNTENIGGDDVYRRLKRATTIAEKFKIKFSLEHQVNLELARRNRDLKVEISQLREHIEKIRLSFCEVDDATLKLTSKEKTSNILLLQVLLAIEKVKSIILDVDDICVSVYIGASKGLADGEDPIDSNGKRLHHTLRPYSKSTSSAESSDNSSRVSFSDYNTSALSCLNLPAGLGSSLVRQSLSDSLVSLSLVFSFFLFCELQLLNFYLSFAVRIKYCATI